MALHVTGGRDLTSALSVVVPASSANLGCAFDCAALALNLYLRARAVWDGSSGFRIRYCGPNSDRVPEDDSNLVAKAISRVAHWAGTKAPGASIEISNEIPVSAGLGASAAAVVAGLLLGVRFCGLEQDAVPLLQLAVELEGHPDNAAAAYRGGLVFAAQCESPADVLVARTTVPSDLRIIAVVPELALPTKRSRAILPEHYAQRDAVHNLQRAALLAAFCFSGQYNLPPELFRDRLHQPYRSHLAPGLAACLQLEHPSLLGVFLSGAGPTVLALARNSEKEIASGLAKEFRRHNVPTQTLLLYPDNRGAQISVVDRGLRTKPNTSN